jgi:hypothetical protein
MERVWGRGEYFLKGLAFESESQFNPNPNSTHFKSIFRFKLRSISPFAHGNAV